MKSIRKTATSLKMKTPAQSKTMKTRRFWKHLAFQRLFDFFLYT
jgi:hypothetical protein